MKKVVYFATGSPEEAAADLERLRLSEGEVSLRVVVPSGMARQLERLALLRPEQVLAYSPLSALLLWLRLWKFLGLSPQAEVICLKSPRRFRALKFLALVLPGRLAFSDGKEARPPCSRFRLVWVSLGQAIAGKGPVCVVTSASPARLSAIVACVRQRYPAARVHGLLLASLGDGVAGSFDSCHPVERPGLLAYIRLLPHCIGPGRFQAIVLPCTNENYSGLKWLAWWLPLWRVEVYNENLDAFSGRNFYLLARHGLWRMRQQRESRRQRRERRREERERRHRSLPVGVVGSASAFYLKGIIPAVRARFPEARLHALLPASLERPAQGLFDSTTILKPGIGSALWQVWRVSKAGGPFQCWIVPCTNEPYRRMKLLAFLLPLSRRHIYNEIADGFPVRDFRTFWGHLAWRARDRLSFQIIAGTAGKNPGLRLLHLSLYTLRLLSAAPLLWRARLRSYLHQRTEYPPSSRSKRPSVDLVYLGPGEPEQSIFEQPHFDRDGARVCLALKAGGLGWIDKINTFIQNSQAEFICLMDSRCKMLAEDWLDRLLVTFDDRTAQVGPQIVRPEDGTFIRGLLLGREGDPRWNSDNAVCWHRRPEWLTVDAVPWVCVLFRRSVFLQVGFFLESWDGEGMWVDLDFCRRLAAHGWHSVCNQSVTAVHPASTAAGELRPALGISPALEISEDRR